MLTPEGGPRPRLTRKIKHIIIYPVQARREVAVASSPSSQDYYYYYYCYYFYYSYSQEEE